MIFPVSCSGIVIILIRFMLPAEQNDRSTPGMLTERQREVLEKLLNGRTIAQAAQELGIAEGTAKHHALAVYAAYGVSSRADLILAATRQGTGTG